MMRHHGERQFTGLHMLAALVTFFGVIIAVNLVMASFATRSWTGLVVKNSYVASQTFNDTVAAMREQDELGWQGKLSLDDGIIAYRLEDRSGAVIGAQSIDITFKRPSYEGADHTVALTRRDDGVFAAPHRLDDGIWVVEVMAAAGSRTGWHQSFRVTVAGGRIVR
ncbi:MAG: FixH family protein [Rhizobiaceae bacterium]